MLTGMDLKVERVKARVTAQSLASVLGVSRQRISAIESLAIVPDQAAQRYRAALVSLTRRPETVADAAS